MQGSKRGDVHKPKKCVNCVITAHVAPYWAVAVYSTVTKSEGIGARPSRVQIPVRDLKYIDFSHCFFINKIGTIVVTTSLFVSGINFF